MAIQFDFKDRYDFNDLVSIVALLRAPGGCPWDQEQTHASIKKNFIEETYEAIEAINKDDPEMLCEELGDVMLQVALHTQMEDELGNFGFNDVADGICKKLILRHPHVFGDVKADTASEVLSNWDAIKQKEKGIKTASDSMGSVPREFPALMRAQKVQSRAAKSGFDWESVDGAFAKLFEEISELKSALAEGDSVHTEAEFGDVLFSCVNISRFIKVDSEQALTVSTDKFLSRFAIVEQLAHERGMEIRSASPEELDTLWAKAKQILSD